MIHFSSSRSSNSTKGIVLAPLAIDSMNSFLKSCPGVDVEEHMSSSLDATAGIQNLGIGK